MPRPILATLIALAFQLNGTAEAACPTGQICITPLEGGPTAARTLTERERESHVFFPEGGASLGKAAQRQLDALSRVLATGLLGSACLKLEGHADASGTVEGNLRLSLARAEAVAGYLRQRLDRAERVVLVTGEGASRPLPGYPATAAENRRVAVLARRCDS